NLRARGASTNLGVVLAAPRNYLADADESESAAGAQKSLGGPREPPRNMEGTLASDPLLRILVLIVVLALILLRAGIPLLVPALTIPLIISPVVIAVAV